MSDLLGRAFVESAFRDGVPAAAVVLKCRNWGVYGDRAIDLADEAAAEAYRRSLDQSFQNQCHYRAWITRTAINAAIDALRASSRFWSLNAITDCPTVSLSDNETVEVIAASLSKLPHADQIIIRMTFEEGLTLDEIVERTANDDAGTMNAKRLRVKRRRDAAMQLLRTYLMKHELSDGQQGLRTAIPERRVTVDKINRLQ